MKVFRDLVGRLQDLEVYSDCRDQLAHIRKAITSAK